MQKKVYILGAGASNDLRFRMSTLDVGYSLDKDFHAEGPLSSGYFYYFNQILKMVDEGHPFHKPFTTSDRFLKYVCQKYEITRDDLFDNKNLSKKVNIENLYKAIETEVDEIELKCGDSDDPSVLRNPKLQKLLAIQWDLEDCIFDTLSFIGYHCISKLHHVFADYLVETGDDVISFNWDTLLDEAMFNTGRWSYETGYGFKFEKVVYRSGDNHKNIIQSSGSRILKPHGSINWYSDQNKEKMYAVLPELRSRGGTFGQLGRCESIGEQHVYNYLVPPGKKRKHFPHIWESMRDILQNADKIIAIGFSFNGNDDYIKKEFENIKFKPDLSVAIIDPNGNLLLDVYKEVFNKEEYKTRNVFTRYSSFAQYCDEISIQEIRV